MKRIALMLVAGVILASFVFAAKPASAGLSFEDPQICLNGKLLMIEPTTSAIDVWVVVGSSVKVDLNVVNCGGNASLPTVDPSHVSHLGAGNAVRIVVRTKKGTDVLFLWNGHLTTLNSGNDQWIYVSTYI